MDLAKDTSLNSKVTQREFGQLVGISQPAVSDLLKREVLFENGTAAEWLKSYCSHLREQAAGRSGTGELDLVTERARLAKEQADRISLQNYVSRRELAPVILIEEVLAKAATKISGIFDAIPGMIRRRVASLTSEDIDMITAEIAKARNIIAAMSLGDLDDDGEDLIETTPVVEV